MKKKYAQAREARADTAFLRGQLGADGKATEQVREEAEIELSNAREQYLKGKAYLGREFLTWLLWKSESGDPICNREGEPLVVMFSTKTTLRGIAGEVTELSARGALAPYSPLVRSALMRGLLLHSARIQLTHGEKSFEFTIDAEYLDIKSAKLPELMTAEEDDQLTERLWLCEELAGNLQALVEEFLRIRTGPDWSKKVVPALKKWMKD